MNTINEKTAQQIVDAVRDVCNFHINFMNNNGIIIASTDPLRIGTFHEAGKLVTETGTPLEIDTDDSLPGTRKGINIPISHNGAVIAAVGISGEPDQTRPYARLAEQITRLIIHEQELNAAVRTANEKKNYLINLLRRGNTENPSHIARLLDEFHLDPAEPKRVLIFRLRTERTNSISMIESKMQNLFCPIPDALFCYQYPNEFIAVLNASAFDTHQHFIKSFIEKEHPLISAGIGRAENPFQLDASFQTAEAALQSLQNTESYALFDDLSLEIILGLVPGKYKEEFLIKTLHQLSSDDIALLHVYFEAGCSLSSACERLYMHKNTLQYNLDRIHRTCGLNPRDFKDAVILYLAIKIRRMKS